MEITDNSIKPFVFPERMKALRYLIAYTAHSQDRWQDEEAHCARLRRLGYDVEGFCVSIPSPGDAWHFPRLEMEWRRRSGALLQMYEVLEKKLQTKDVLVLWTGAMLHPEFVSQLSTYNVYVCSDDPESSDGLSKPVARYFDYAFTRNIACVERYRQSGCQRVKWLCAAVDPDFCDAMLTEEQIRDAHRDLDLVLFCERLSGLGGRPQRIERLLQAFPQTYVRGRGWPGGYVSKAEMISAYGRAKIGWNFHLSVGPNNSRLTALPAFGILQVCDNKANLGKIFKLDEEVVGFDTLEECLDKTRYYLDHPREARAIAARGWKRAMTDYTETREWERILAAIAPHCLPKQGEGRASNHNLASGRHAGSSAAGLHSAKEDNVKLHLGCGNDYWPGYMNIDANQGVKADLYTDFKNIGKAFSPDTVSEVCIIHALNYLNLWQARSLFATVYELLKSDGKFVIETVNIEKAAQQILENVGQYDAHIEGIRALHAFGIDQLERRDEYIPYAFSWSPWHLVQELEAVGFHHIQVLPAQTHQPWRDMRLEASKPIQSTDNPGNTGDQEVGTAVRHCRDIQHQRRRRVLFVLDPVMGHVTSHVRGLIFKDILRERGWTAEFVDARQVPEDTIVAMASSVDLVYLLKVPFFRLVERLAKETEAKIVFDLTDALWKPHHRQDGWHELERILTDVDAVFVENQYVESYANRYNKHVIDVPTSTQVERFDAVRHVVTRNDDDKVVLGWVGSTGTARGLFAIQKPLENLFARHQDLELRIIGCADPHLLPRFQNVRFAIRERYDEEDMIRELLAMDIGLYPPPLDVEDYCLRGPLKALIYMTAGLPAVCHNAGDCSRIIEDGVTGMLAMTPEEWETKLDILIREPALRRRIGAQALQAVRGEHSLERVCSRLEEAFLEVMHREEQGPSKFQGKEAQGDACESQSSEGLAPELIPFELAGLPILKGDIIASSQAEAKSPRPRMLLIADVPNWIFARHCKMLEQSLADEFDIKTVFHGDSYNEDDYDLIYPLEWNLLKPEQIRTPAKYITGIRSHLHWPNLDFFAFVNFLSTHFQRVHVVSERLHRMFAPFLPTVTYVTHGIDTTFFTPSTQADQSGGKVRIGWAGNRNSSENKGFKDIIEPLGRLPGVELVFCGYSDKNLSMAEMRQFYDAIDIYVCASVNEGSNNSLLEAAAMERAIITTENGTVSEYLQDGDSAIIVERHLPLFIQAVQTLRDDPARRVALGKRARQAVLQGWDWRDKAADYRAFFQEALAMQEEHRREKLNILLVAHGFPPRSLAGTELYTYHLAQELLKRGHAVRVLYPEYDTHRAAGDVIEDSYHGVPITRLNLLLSPDMMHAFKNDEAASAFGRYVAHLDVDVVHFQHLIGFSAAAIGVCVQQQIPTTLTLHDAWTLCEQTHLLRSDGTLCSGPETVDKCVQCLVSRYPQHSLSDHLPEMFYITAARRQFIKRMLAGLDALLVPTQFLQRMLAAYDLEHPRTVFAPLGLPSFSTLPWQPSTGPLRLTFLGNIAYTKGVDVAIRAFNLIEPEKACLSLYGAVTDAAYWHRVLAEVEPGHQVEHHGAYTPEDLPEILARTDVAVIPSRAENFPTVIRECLHAGVPVIGSNVGGVPEIIQDGVNGFLFEANDHEDLAAKLQFFIRNPEQVNVFRQRIRPVRSIAEDAATIEGLYREIIMQKAAVTQEETLGSTPHAVDQGGEETAPANGSTPAGGVPLTPRLEKASGSHQLGEDDDGLECSVIIPVFNKVDLTKQCLMHLSQVTQGVEYEVIVVDNASSDGTQEFLASLSGDVQIISNEANLGFAKACNQGARAAKGRYLVFLNNDTIPLEGWLAAMVDEVETHPEVAVVGSKLLYPDDTIQHAGVVFARAGFLPYHVYSRVPSDVAVVNRRREFQVVTAACMLVRKEVFEAVGGFDEGYRNGFEDVDLCLKIRDQGGRVVYQPKSVLYHLESQTPGRKDYDQENGKRLLGRWGDRWLVDEDVVCGEDGFVIRKTQKNGHTYARLESLANAPDKASWERVAEVERLTLSGHSEAARLLLAQIDLWPDDLGVLSWAAQVCMRIGVPEYAEVFWRRMLKYEGVFDARAGLARLSMERGAFDEAEEHLKVLSIQGDGESWILQGVLALQRQQYVEAVDAFKAALQHGANSRKVQLGLGMATMGLGQMDRAWEHFATVLSHEIDDAEAVHCLLRAGAALERWRPLADYLVNYLRLNPGDSSVRFALAGVHVRLEDWEGAREAYEMIRLLDPTFEGLDDLAQILTKQTHSVNA